MFQQFMNNNNYDRFVEDTPIPSPTPIGLDHRANSRTLGAPAGRDDRFVQNTPLPLPTPTPTEFPHDGMDGKPMKKSWLLFVGLCVCGFVGLLAIFLAGTYYANNRMSTLERQLEQNAKIANDSALTLAHQLETANNSISALAKQLEQQKEKIMKFDKILNVLRSLRLCTALNSTLACGHYLDSQSQQPLP